MRSAITAASCLMLPEGCSPESPPSSDGEPTARIDHAIWAVPAEVVHAQEPRIAVHRSSERGFFQLTGGRGLLDYCAARCGESIG